MNQNPRRTKDTTIESLMTAAIFTYGLLWAIAALLAPLAIIKLCLDYLS